MVARPEHRQATQPVSGWRLRSAALLAIVLTVTTTCHGGRTSSYAAQPSVPAPAETEQPNAMSLDQAIDLMRAFAERTGLTSERPPRRYLWTDAFAVCNYLGLARATGKPEYLGLAQRLVEQVHHTLGRHRPDDVRRGWISGLSEEEGEAHPTRGGLRIGKPLPERRAGEVFDERLEWDRDGQYFHYLTKWMHALDLMSRSTGDAAYNGWARELAASAEAAFTYTPEGSARPLMVWKMSIDLERPLVSSMGHHDPLDGYISVRQLRATAARLSGLATGPRLDRALLTFAAMSERRDWTTSDPLGLGGLLMDAYRFVQIESQSALAGRRRDRDPQDTAPPPRSNSQESDGSALVETLLTAALRGVERFGPEEALDQPAAHRLAFRELGLAIGLAGLELMAGRENGSGTALANDSPIRQRLEALLRYVPVRQRIVSFWSEPEHRTSRAWTEHQDINDVMLATALVPQGCLVLPEVPTPRLP